MAEQEQIEAEVTGPEAKGPEVAALDAWDVWYVDRHQAWECEDAGCTKPQAIAHARRLVGGGNQVRLVHYTLPALTIKAEEK